MGKAYLSFIPAIVWFIFLTILLVLPGSALPNEKWFGQVELDKWVHIFLFFIVVTLWCMPFRKIFEKRKQTVVFVIIALSAIVYGIGMEFIQKYYIPGRSFELMDMGADAVGSSAGLIFSYLRFIKK